MSDHLDRLARTALETIRRGYYARPPRATRPTPPFGPLLERQAGTVVAEIKPASPSGGRLSARAPEVLIAELSAAGADGLSVLTEPVHFGGSLTALAGAADVGRPLLFKDFLLDPVQLEAAAAGGASAVLLILALFERGYATLSLSETIRRARALGLEVLLEVYDEQEYARARRTSAEMIGINNRDLKTLRVDLATTERVLAAAPKDRPVWSLSGMETPEDVRRMRRAGADAFLIGSALMRAGDPQGKLQALRTALADS